MSPHKHANPWLLLPIGLFFLWGVVRGVIRGRLNMRGSYVIKRSSEPWPFWIHVIFATLVSMMLIVAGIKGVAFPDAQVPWMSARVGRNLFFALVGVTFALLGAVYLVQGNVPSKGRPITRRDRPVNYCLTIVLLFGMAYFGFYEAFLAWPWVVASAAPSP